MNGSIDDAFQILIFAPSGYQQALRLIEKDDWKGHALMCKRAIFPDVQHRPELSRPGVYLLYGPSEDNDQSISLYVGEGDPTLPRLKAHTVKKDFWTDLICFTSAENLLSKSHIQFLEARLINMAFVAKRCRLENVRHEELPTLSEAQVALSERFLKNMLDCLSAVGIHFFDAAPRVTLQESESKVQYCISGKGIYATGFESANGFVVTEGSTATKQLSNSFAATKLRERLLADGVLLDDGEMLRFALDYEFESPSAAGSIVYGHGVNGRSAWHRPDGTTLKAVQEMKLGIA